jgi:predicted outer membrane repeat protein
LGQATIINVPGDQTTIQNGIDAAVDGDTVLVQPGIYEQCLDYEGKNIVVASLFLTTQDTSYISRTVIDGKGYCTGVTFANGEDSTAVLTGFTVTNGVEDCGGGIRCSGASPTLADLDIVANSADAGSGAGGGIYCWEASPSLTNVTLAENSAGAGGGMHCIESSPKLSNVIVIGNTASLGGGITCWGSNASLSGVSVIANTADYGGGIYLLNPGMAMVNTAISENTAETGGGIYCSGESELTLVNSILWNDSPEEIYVSSSCSALVVYSNIQGGWSGEGNIDFDPLFADAAGGNYHLLDASPCIGAGTDSIQIGGMWYYAPATDFDGNPRPNPPGSSPDMGAYENVLGLPIMALSGTLSDGELVLQWTPCVSTAAYWIHGTDNHAYFDPGIGNVVGVVPPTTLTFSSANGIGDPNNNWTYLIVAVDDIDQEITRSNFFGEHDFEEGIP